MSEKKNWRDITTTEEAWNAWCNLRDYLKAAGVYTDETTQAMCTISDALMDAEKGGLFV